MVSNWFYRRYECESISAQSKFDKLFNEKLIQLTKQWLESPDALGYSELDEYLQKVVGKKLNPNTALVLTFDNKKKKQEYLMYSEYFRRSYRAKIQGNANVIKLNHPQDKVGMRNRQLITRERNKTRQKGVNKYAKKYRLWV